MVPTVSLFVIVSDFGVVRYRLFVVPVLRASSSSLALCFLLHPIRWIVSILLFYLIELLFF